MQKKAERKITGEPKSVKEGNERRKTKRKKVRKKERKKE